MTLRSLQVGMGWFPEHPGGLNRVFEHLVRELAAQGTLVTGLVTGSPGVARATHGRVRAFAPTRASMARRLAAVRTAASPWLRASFGPDEPAVVASHFALHAYPLLGQLARHPLVVHFHGPWALESLEEGSSRLTASMKERVERAVYRRADAAIVLSSAFAQLLESRFQVPRDRIHVIPGGVEVERFASTRPRVDLRRELGWVTDRPIILCVRRLVRRVGLDILIDAAALVRARVPEALFLIAGTGPMRDDLEARIQSAGLTDTVRLLGFVPDDQLPLAYRAADLTVVPSVALEGFGLVTAESLAAGTPAIVTPVGGLTDVITPLDPALVTRSATASDLAAVIADVLLGVIQPPSDSTCASFARERFAWPVIAQRARDVYLQAAGR